MQFSVSTYYDGEATMQTKVMALLVSAGLMSGFSASVCAQQSADDTGWYGGVAVGTTKVKIDDGVLPITGSTASSLSKDDSASVFGFGLGYDFSRNWALEGGYAHNRKLSARRTSTAGTVGTLGAQGDGSAWSLAGIGKLPLQDRFYVYGKLGLAATTTKTNLDATGAATLPAGGASRKKSEWNPLWGLGVGYDFNRSFGLRVDYTQTANVGDSNTGEHDVNTFSVGLKFRF